MTECCVPPPLILPPQAGRLPLLREAFRLEWLTIGWMTVEAVIAISAGVMAGSLVLVAFGLDSVIELASAGVGAVAGVVGIEGGVVSEVINLESSGVEAPDRRPRHDQHYHEAGFLAA